MDFKAWMTKQTEREDNIGRLARFIIDKEIKYRSGRRKPNEHRKWASTITYHAKDMTLIHAFNQAWQEYQAQTEMEPA